MHSPHPLDRFPLVRRLVLVGGMPFAFCKTGEQRVCENPSTNGKRMNEWLGFPFVYSWLYSWTAAAAGVPGGSFQFKGKSSTTAAQVMGEIDFVWKVATHASAVSDVVLSAAYNSGAAIVNSEFLRGRGGSTPFIGINSAFAGTGFTYLVFNVKGGQMFVGQDSTSETPIFQIVPAYISSTHSTYTTRTIFSAWDASGALEVMRFENQSSVQYLSFFGATAVVKQTGIAAQKTTYAAGNLDTEAEIIAAFNTTNAAINGLRTALNNFGLTTVV
jgi:hypothetical protein